MHIMNIFQDWELNNEVQRNLQMNKNRSSGPDTFFLLTAPFGGQQAAVIKELFSRGSTVAWWQGQLCTNWTVTGVILTTADTSIIGQIPSWTPTCSWLQDDLDKCKKCKYGAQKPPGMWRCDVSCCKHSLLWLSNHLDHRACAQGQMKDVYPLFCFVFFLLLHQLCIYFWPNILT